MNKEPQPYPLQPEDEEYYILCRECGVVLAVVSSEDEYGDLCEDCANSILQDSSDYL